MTGQRVRLCPNTAQFSCSPATVAPGQRENHTSQQGTYHSHFLIWTCLETRNPVSSLTVHLLSISLMPAVNDSNVGEGAAHQPRFEQSEVSGNA